MTEADVAFSCVWAFVDRLVARGMEHACVSPGSRSTPLALALSRHPGVRVHVHLDERASAFFALGIAKASGRPVAVACTSGTAAAEFLPAVVEASMSRVPLVLLTADRPRELHGVGANQTIDQSGLYGRHVKGFVETPVPGEDPDPSTWRRLADAVIREAVASPPGPMHVDLPFREPLVPTSFEFPETEGDEGLVPEVEQEEEEPPGLDGLLAAIRSADRGVILAGSLREPPRPLSALAERLRWPLLAEPTSGLRGPGALAAGQFLLANEDFASAHVPDLVLQVGAAPTSRAGLAFVREARALWILDPDDLVGDPNRVAAGRVVARPDRLEPMLGERASRGDETWMRQWREADARAAAAVAATIEGWDEPFEGRIAREVAGSAPEGSTLVVGSSMPVRDLDAYMEDRAGLRVLANRGASGIDGFVSTAFGVSATGTPTTTLLGDLTLLHDVGSLLWAAGRGLEALFVVVNNDGGVIFSFLDQRELPEFEELFRTPHGLDLGAICTAARARHTLVDRAGDLVPAIGRARSSGGVQVVEVRVDPDLNVRRHAEVFAAVAEALAAPTM